MPDQNPVIRSRSPLLLLLTPRLLIGNLCEKYFHIMKQVSYLISYNYLIYRRECREKDFLYVKTFEL